VRGEAAAFVITIDTEEDDSWNPTPAPTTENARFLPRFQSLCEGFGLKPTYLVNHPMAEDARFQALGRDVLRRATGEIGLHIHAWSSPPATGVAEWDSDPIYITELPDDWIHTKMVQMTEHLAKRFETPVVSHRSGRWGFDGRVAAVLEKLGYRVDCSVTPGISWRHKKGARNGAGGPSFRGFPIAPYFLDPSDIRRPGASPVLEVPVTIRPAYPPLLQRLHDAAERSVVGKALRRVLGAPYLWLRPDGRNLTRMIGVVDWALARGLPVVEFMLHSSELMPGASPTFRTDDSIERLYQQLQALFAHVTGRGLKGQTLGEFRSSYAA